MFEWFYRWLARKAAIDVYNILEAYQPRKSSPRVLVVIPARGGSKGIPGKNIVPLAGKPLIGYTIEAALKSTLATRVCVSTDDEVIADVARNYGVDVIKRPPEIATDEAPLELSLRHAVSHLKENEGFSPDIVVCLQANVPIRKEGQIDNAIKKLISTKADSVITVTLVRRRPEWMKNIVDEDKLVPVQANTDGFRRQDYPDLYIADGAVIAIMTDVLMTTEGLTGIHAYMGKDIRAIVEDPEYAIEIDDPFDLRVAEGLLSHNID